MQDLEIAKERLNEEGLALSVVKGGEMIFESVSHGISGFLEAVERLEEKLEGASVADRVVGKAIALLCVYAKVRALYLKSMQFIMNWITWLKAYLTWIK